jgi:hypothetical protein
MCPSDGELLNPQPTFLPATLQAAWGFPDESPRFGKTEIALIAQLLDRSALRHYRRISKFGALRTTRSSRDGLCTLSRDRPLDEGREPDVQM